MIRRMISFEECNLAEVDATFWTQQEFDVMFCRNCMMYLVPNLMQRIVERLTTALVPGGFLFLGHAETLRGLSDAYHLRHTHDTFYYQKREQRETTPAGAATLAYVPEVPVSRIVPPAESWADVIGAASERIQRLTTASGKAGDAGTTSQPVSESSNGMADQRINVGLALGLLRQEKFRDALAVLGQIGRGPSADTDAQLLRTVLLANCGDISTAEAACAEVLAANDLNAGAHYVMAICREQSGDRSGAMEEDRIAIHLDPAFAIPRLHLGILARRSGDAAAARIELQQALVLLLREDASRILLFGGGFSREALVDFARAELRACGGTA
jgi:chemotaxis protein methyltransferase CheR